MAKSREARSEGVQPGWLGEEPLPYVPPSDKALELAGEICIGVGLPLKGPQYKAVAYQIDAVGYGFLVERIVEAQEQGIKITRWWFDEQQWKPENASRRLRN